MLNPSEGSEIYDHFRDMRYKIMSAMIQYYSSYIPTRVVIVGRFEINDFIRYINITVE